MAKRRRIDLWFRALSAAPASERPDLLQLLVSSLLPRRAMQFRAPRLGLIAFDSLEALRPLALENSLERIVGEIKGSQGFERGGPFERKQGESGIARAEVGQASERCKIRILV